ncbi:MgtC/SapB family protein, partial [Neptunomonas sp.]
DAIDPSRVIGQVITGIGFLGAGVMLAKDGAVVGVTSAATIWMLAAIGVIISSGYLFAAIKISILVVGILYGVDLLEEHTKAFSRGVHAKVRGFTIKR